MDFSTLDSSPLFEDHTLLPVQFADLQRSAVRPPEHRLLYAVLEDAVRCYQVYEGATSPRRQRLYQEAVDWFASEDDSSPFTFVAICQVFDLEPDFVRRGMRRWSETHRARPGKVVPFRLRRVSGTRHMVKSKAPASVRARAHG
jgi:hypothetical protein